MKNLTYLILAGLLISCGSSNSEGEQSSSSQQTVGPAITLTKAPASPEFPDATLTKTDVTVEPNDSSNSVNYAFDVANSELGAQTEDAATRGIANSGKGQHIHFIVNNGPYSAHYMPGVSNQLGDGNYVVLAFLSRSYHESVKSPGAFHIENLTVGDMDMMLQYLKDVQNVQKKVAELTDAIEHINIVSFIHFIHSYTNLYTRDTPISPCTKSYIIGSPGAT